MDQVGRPGLDGAVPTTGRGCWRDHVQKVNRSLAPTPGTLSIPAWAISCWPLNSRAQTTGSFAGTQALSLELRFTALVSFPGSEALGLELAMLQASQGLQSADSKSEVTNNPRFTDLHCYSLHSLSLSGEP